jgi:hypothetical protein
MMMGDAGIQPAKSTSSKGQVFTNCGKIDDQETAAKPRDADPQPE